MRKIPLTSVLLALLFLVLTTSTSTKAQPSASFSFSANQQVMGVTLNVVGLLLFSACLAITSSTVVVTPVKQRVKSVSDMYSRAHTRFLVDLFVKWLIGTAILGFLLFMGAGVSQEVGVFFGILFTIFFLGFPFYKVAKGIEISFSEEWEVSVSPSEVQEYIRLVAVKFRELFPTEDIRWSISNNTLTINATATSVVPGKWGHVKQLSKPTKFKATLTFTPKGSKALLRIDYHLSCKARSFATKAAESFVNGLETALFMVADEMSAKKIVVVDFAEIISKLSEIGLTVKELKCPNCGANLNLPEKSRELKCPYCGATLTAFDAYKLIRNMIKEVFK